MNARPTLQICQSFEEAELLGKATSTGRRGRPEKEVKKENEKKDDTEEGIHRSVHVRWVTHTALWQQQSIMSEASLRGHQGLPSHSSPR